MVRITTFCLLVLLSVGIILPYANSAHGIRQSAQMGQRNHHRYHSRAWWRRYRARMRRKRAAAALAHRNALLAVPTNIQVGDLGNVVISQSPMTITSTPSRVAPNAPVPMSLTTPLTLPVSAPATASVPRTLTTTPTVQVAVTTSTAPVTQTAPVPVASSTNVASLKPKAKSAIALPGQMNLAVVALSRPNPAFLTSREASRMLAGVDIGDLRRIVIDKMVVAGGWVINDYVSDVNGARVFVVLARTPKDAREPEKVWTFYFTEMGGRIYGLTTDSAVENSDRMAEEAERVITALHARAEANK
ncbi:MAG: hypothetical protein C5B55_08535 [Blastocatellia bacterium]|nr:MAG: hypothetical protein C5B55_08535 [Blastocatellia bacterium]